MKILKEWLDFSKDVRPSCAAGEDLLSGLRGETAQKIASIEAKKGELQSLYDAHFEYRHKVPQTEDENLSKTVALALAKERMEFIYFLDSL